MSLKAIQGRDAYILLDENKGVGTPKYTKYYGQKDLSISRSMETLDATTKSSTGKEVIPSLIEWSAEFDSLVYSPETDAESSYDLLEYHFNNRVPIKVQIVIGTRTLEGEGYITDFPLDMPLDDFVSASITISGTGDLVYTVSG